jgi:hypothetical protein
MQIKCSKEKYIGRHVKESSVIATFIPLHVVFKIIEHVS